MTPISRTLARTALAFSIATLIPAANAVTKENNTDALSLGTSWVGGTPPTSSDIALWNNTVAGANTVAAGGNLDWQGIQIANPGGAITITNATGNTLALGSSGIDLSAATQNANIFTTAAASTIVVGASQTWSVGTGRILTLFNTSNTLNIGLTGSNNIQIAGAGTVVMATGDATSTTFAGGGNAGFSGNWIIGTGTAGSGRLELQRNGVNAWGTGTITLNGGTIAQRNGSWTWTNNISLASGVTSTIDDANTGGTTRTLKLQGVISGDGNLTFAETGAGAQTNETGYILTNTNTLSGTVTINSGVFVRIGGVPGNDTTTGVGSGGTLGTAGVVNNGTLTLSRNNTWTFGNQMSGSGLLRIGLNTGSASHIVTVSGNNSHTGGTTLQSAVTLRIGHVNAVGTGTFTVNGNGFIENATGSTLTLGNAFALSGGSPTFVGTQDFILNGAVTLAAANRTMTVNSATVTVNGNIGQDASARGLTKSGLGTLVLGGTNAFAGNAVVNGGALVLDYGTNDTTKLADAGTLTLGAVRLTLAGGSGSHTELVSATTINGAALITRSGANTAEIALGAITRSAGGFLDVQSANLANTTTANVNGILQGVTLGGADLAANDGANNIVAFTGYADVTRLESGAKSITDGATQQIRVTDGSGSAPAPVTLAAAGTTNINNLANSATGGGSTVEVGVGNTLRLGAAGIVIAGTGTGGFSIAGGTLTAGGVDNTAGDLHLVNSGATMHVSSSIANNGTGAITLTKSGTGTVVLSGSNAHTGTTTIRGGTLELSGGSAIADTGAVTLSNVAGATLKLNASESIGNLTGGGPLGGTVDIGANTLTVATATGVQVLGAAITGNGGFIKGGTGELALEGTNTFSGQITITTGTLAFRGINSENGKPAVHVDASGNLALGNEFAGATATIGALSGSGGVNPQFDQQLGVRTLLVEQDTDTVFSGVMRNTTDTTQRILGFAKSGAGTLELSGISTYTGPTTINGGMLYVTGSISGSATAVNGGTLSGTGTVGAVTVNSGGTIAPGSSPGTLTAGNTLFNGGTLAIELNGTLAGVTYDQLSAVGTVGLTADSSLSISLGFDPADGVDIFTIIANDGSDPVSGPGLFTFAGNPLSEGSLFTVSGQNFSISYVGGDGNDVIVAAVPEPGSAAMLLGGFGMLLGLRRRRIG